jgi:septum formation protein
MVIVLASASPRRRHLLTEAGFTCEVDAVDVDERQLAGESPERYVERVGLLKATAGAARHPGRVVVAADTVVVVGEEIFGKPVDATDAWRMLQRLSGGSHRVLTGLVVVGRAVVARVECTTVWFNPLSEADIAWYVASGEPMDKAGAYAIQGLASRFIPRIDGSYSNVVGLPVATLVQALHAAGAAASARPGRLVE